MPFIITDPETKTITQRYVITNPTNDDVVEVSAVRTIDRVNIEHIITSMPINNPTGVSMTVKWSIGYMDGAVFFPTERGSAELAGEALLAKMVEPVIPGATHYSDHKTALYELLVALGHIPAGSIV
jgi:hypothetical protein